MRSSQKFYVNSVMLMLSLCYSQLLWCMQENVGKWKLKIFKRIFEESLAHFLMFAGFVHVVIFDGNFKFSNRTSKPEIDKHNEQFTTPRFFVICLSCWEYFAADTAKLQLSLHVSLVHKTAVFSFRNYRRWT